ncbi:MAG: glutamate formimidoyltransferase, partial [Candidatus Methanofastidiosia archaeon]
MKLIECVPNFSEGTNEKVIKEILDVFRNSDVKLLDKIYDKEYNRLVVTIVGDAERVKEAVLKASDVAISKIDMRKHRGSHPRIGAVDVVPFVPLKNTTMGECIALSREFARELSEKHNLPVFLYEKSATSPERRDIDFLRKGEFEGLLEALKERKPDLGPEKPHKTAGATIIGAREIMVGLNVNLSTSDLEVAKKIAKAIHSKSGGLMYVKAM